MEVDNKQDKMIQFKYLLLTYGCYRVIPCLMVNSGSRHIPPLLPDPEWLLISALII